MEAPGVELWFSQPNEQSRVTFAQGALEDREFLIIELRDLGYPTRGSSRRILDPLVPDADPLADINNPCRMREAFSASGSTALD